MRLLAPLALVVSMLLLYVPFRPVFPGSGLDPSWMLGMNELMSRGAIFGQDVIFTFGPLASVYTIYFHPATDSLAMAASLVLALSAIACWRVILAGRSNAAWLGVSLVCWLCLNSRDALLFAVPLLACLATAFWVLDQRSSDVDLEHSPLPHGPMTPVWLVMAWGAVGLLPLVKGTMLVMTVALTVLTALFLLTQRRALMAGLVLLAPSAVSISAWAALGQGIDNLPLYVNSMSEIIVGYTEAMSYGLDKPRNRVQLALFSLMAMMLLRRAYLFGLQRDRLTANFFVVVLAACLFLSFKAAFVRHDEGHAILAMNVALVLVCVAWARFDLPRAGRWKWAVVAGLLWYAVMMGYQGWGVGHHLAQWWASQKASVGAVFDRATRSTTHVDEFNASFKAIRAAYPIPRLPGTMDVYSTNHAVAMAYALPWNPRPVLQSYSAYTPALARLNRDHLLGERAPDWVWFTVEPIDGRLASQEDGASWPVLLRDYEPIQKARGGMVLKRRVAGAASVPALGAILLQKRITLGERIEVPRDGGALSFSLNARRNWLGQLMHTALKSRSLMIELELASGETRRMRLVSGMLVEPVVLSPLIESSEEFALLYGDLPALADKRVVAMKLMESDRGPSHWQQSMEVTIRTAPEVGLQPEALHRASPLPALQPVADKVNLQPIECQGHVDAINAEQTKSDWVFRAQILRARGWAWVADANAKAARRPFLLLADGRGHWKIPLESESRTDVATHLGKGTPTDVGWTAMGDLRAVTGDFSLTLAYEDDGLVQTCSNLSFAMRRP
jgi:hypothetical protein